MDNENELYQQQTANIILDLLKQKIFQKENFFLGCAGVDGGGGGGGGGGGVGDDDMKKKFQVIQFYPLQRHYPQKHSCVYFTS